MLQDGGCTRFTCFVILSDGFSLVQFAKYLQSTCCMKDTKQCLLAIKDGPHMLLALSKVSSL